MLSAIIISISQKDICSYKWLLIFNFHSLRYIAKKKKSFGWLTSTCQDLGLQNIQKILVHKLDKYLVQTHQSTMYNYTVVYTHTHCFEACVTPSWTHFFHYLYPWEHTPSDTTTWIAITHIALYGNSRMQCESKNRIGRLLEDIAAYNYSPKLAISEDYGWERAISCRGCFPWEVPEGGRY